MGQVSPDALGSHSLLEVVPGGVWAASPNGQTAAVSPNVERVCGFTPAEVLEAPGNLWIDRIHPEDALRVQNAYGRLVAAHEPLDSEYRWRRKDGAWIWLRGQAVIRAGTDSRLVDGMVVDITDRKQLQEEVRHLQKIENVGHITAGIAHDFNNLLGVILANDSFLLDALSEGDSRRTDAEAIYQAAERAAALTKQLLSFSRPRAFEPKVLDLPSVDRSLEAPAADWDIRKADHGGTETILVVEDDERVRAVVDRILCRFGYRVVALIDSHEGQVHLILSDVVLPDFGGPEIMNRLSARSPRTKRLFMSGHTSDTLLRDGVLTSESHFIQKPFQPEALAKKVRDVLDGVLETHS